MTQTQSLQHEIDRLGPWFHNLHLPDGTQTAPGHFLGDFPAFKWDALQDAIPQDLAGWTALDIGCNAGFYSIELARRGAEVLGIDHDSRYLRQATWAARQFGFDDRITFRQMEVYDLARMEQRFDLVLFMGVFYHLRYPLLGLDLVADRVGRLLVFQTMMLPGRETLDVPEDLHFHDGRALMREPGFPAMAFIEHRLAGDPTNWWIANQAAVLAMLRSANLEVIDEPLDETYLCRPAGGSRAMNRVLPPVRTEDPGERESGAGSRAS